MALVIEVEDGTGKANANSYASVSDLQSYAEQRGVNTFSYVEGSDAAVKTALDQKIIPFLIRAMDYLEMQSYKGTQQFPGVQALQWPRYVVFGYTAYAGVPTELVKAQCQLCLEQANGMTLVPSSAGSNSGGSTLTLPSGTAIEAADNRPVIREKIDVIETVYADTSTASTQPYMPAVTGLLRNFLTNSGQLIVGRG